MGKVQLKPGIERVHPTSVTLNEKGERVAITGGPLTVETEGTATQPPQKRVIPAASQADLNWLYKQGHPFLEEAETTKEG